MMEQRSNYRKLAKTMHQYYEMKEQIAEDMVKTALLKVKIAQAEKETLRLTYEAKELVAKLGKETETLVEKAKQQAQHDLEVIELKKQRELAHLQKRNLELKREQELQESERALDRAQGQAQTRIQELKRAPMTNDAEKTVFTFEFPGTDGGNGGTGSSNAKVRYLSI